jgi:uncharacterized membrane protein
MNEAEQKMKTYLKQVERRLNLPGDIKKRVMSDFESSIHSRREAGMTDAAIFAELGDAKKAAADLNEQMKEFTYRKSPWRYVFAVVAACGAAKLIKLLIAQILYWTMQIPLRLESASVGVIGGADGPTAILVAGPDHHNHKS